jgi:hypothetical protein
LARRLVTDIRFGDRNQEPQRALRNWMLGRRGILAPMVWHIQGHMVFDTIANRDAFMATVYRPFRVGRHVFRDRTRALDTEPVEFGDDPIPLPPTVRLSVAFVEETETVALQTLIAASIPMGLVRAFYGRHQCRVSFSGDPPSGPFMTPTVYTSFP